MPLFSAQSTINTQHESSWDTYIKSTHPTSNFAGTANIQAGYNVGRSSTTAKRAILAFDLSDLQNRTITSCTLTLRTISGFGLSGSTDFNIHLLDVADSDIVYDEVTWNESKSGTSWSSAGGDIATEIGTYTTPWKGDPDTTFVSTDLTNLLKSKAGGMAFIIIKAAETSNIASAKAVIGHDEDDAASVANLPLLTITSKIDHKYVYDKRELTKFMNKSKGIKGKASVPSVG